VRQSHRTRRASAQRHDRGVARVATQLALELIDLDSQRSDRRSQRHHQLNDRVRIAINRRPQLITPHDRNIPCTIKESCPTRDDPLNAYYELAWDAVTTEDFGRFLGWLRSGDSLAVASVERRPARFSESTVALRLQAVCSFYRFQH